TVMIAGFIFGSVALFHHQGVSLLLITVIFSRLWPRFTGIQSSLENIAAAMPALESIMQLQRESVQAEELGGRLRISEGKEIRPLRFTGTLECWDVYFRYDPQQPAYTLQGIRLSIPANRMTAIVGRSGAGKSTLVDLIMGLLKPDKGEVLLDGKPLSDDDLLSLRRSISYVPQDPFLFHGSIRDNLAIMNASASEEQMWEAMEFSSAAVFVRKLPHAIHTVIRDMGIRLSGVQRLR